MVKRKGTRRGFAGDDVTETKQFQDDVVAERDESFVVEDTDSDHTIETESTVITDDHEVVTSTEVGSEEDFVAESEEGDAETIDEDGRQGRQGRRKGRRKGLRRRGSRHGGDEEDHVEDLEEELGDVEEEIEDVEESEDEEREGRRKGLRRRGSRRKGLRRRGSRRGESVIMDEDGTTEEVDLPEPDEREGRRKGSRKGSEYDLIDNIISVAEREYGDLEDLTQTQADKVCETVAGITGKSVENVKAQLREMDELNGVTRQGSRMGAYGGKSPEHQSSIKAAVTVAMADRRL